MMAWSAVATLNVVMGPPLLLLATGRLLWHE